MNSVQVQVKIVRNEEVQWAGSYVRVSQAAKGRVKYGSIYSIDFKQIN